MPGKSTSKKTSELSEVKLNKTISSAIAVVSDNFYDTDVEIPVERYLDIMSRDGKIRQAIDLPVKMALNSWVGWKHPESQVDSWVKEVFFKQINLKKILYSIASARWTGISASYIVKELYEGNLIARDIVTLPPTSFISNKGIGPKKVKVQPKEGDEKTFPIEDFVIYRHGDTFREPYGVSILSYVFRHYGRKEECVKAWLGFLQKAGIPVRVLFVEPDCPDEEKTALLQGLISSQYEMAMVVPRDVVDGKPTKDLQFIEAQKGAGDFAVFFEKMDREIFTCLGIPELLYNAGSGTYSLGLVQKGTFMKEVQDNQNMLDDILNNHILPPFLMANFGTMEKGKMYFKTTDGREWKEELEAALAWINSPLFSETDANAFRLRLGLEPSDGEINFENQNQAEGDENKKIKNKKNNSEEEVNDDSSV